MYVTEDRSIMVEFVVIQKHVFILFVSNSYMKEIQGTVFLVLNRLVLAMVCISLLSFLFFTKHTQPYICRERPSEKGSRPTVFRRTPTFPFIAVMKNQAVATICGLIIGNQLHICMFVGTNGNNGADLARTKRFNKVKELGIYLVDCPAVATKVETFDNNLWKLVFLNHSAYTTKIWDEQWQICRTLPC
ncbi:hypothetical protein Hanom_Chr11g01041481 [Helianthus anomalus]